MKAERTEWDAVIASAHPRRQFYEVSPKKQCLSGSQTAPLTTTQRGQDREENHWQRAPWLSKPASVMLCPVCCGQSDSYFRTKRKQSELEETRGHHKGPPHLFESN